MIRSLYSGVSGLTNHQTKMDVIGNNIANVNTYGFKSANAIFKDVYYQMAKAPTAGTASSGGNNPATVGYGVQLAGIVKDMSPSNFMNTFQTLDLAISGDGFFITAKFPGTAGGENGADYMTDTTGPTSVTYTRMGMMTIDSFGNLVDMNNRFLLGTRNSAAGLEATGVNSASSLENTQVTDTNGDGFIDASDLNYQNVINVNKLIQEAYAVYTSSSGYLYTYMQPDGTRGSTAYWIDRSGQYQKDSNTVSAFNRAAQGIISALGDSPTAADIATALTDINALTATAGTGAADIFPAGTTITPFMTETFNAIKSQITALTSGAATPFTPTTKDELVGVINKAIADSAIPITGDPDTVTAADAEAMGAIKGEFTVKDLASFTISENGVITTMYNNQMKAIARIELAVFDNPYGLQEAGDTAFAETPASGKGYIKNPNTEGAGAVASGKLEMSNVNLAKEFSDMIVTQRGFQANSRMITVSDSMLEELVNLKR